MQPSNRVIVKDASGNSFGVDLREAQRFEIHRLDNHFDVYYRFNGDLWVQEKNNVFSGSRRFRVVELIDIVYMFLSDRRLKPPEDLMPTLQYSVSWFSTLDAETRKSLDEEETRFWKDRKASLFRLQNGMWAVVELAHPSGAAPHQILSGEEAVNLLLRDGYPTAELPGDLWELCERRRPGTCQPSSKCVNGRHTGDDAFQPAEETIHQEENQVAVWKLANRQSGSALSDKPPFAKPPADMTQRPSPPEQSTEDHNDEGEENVMYRITDGLYVFRRMASSGDWTETPCDEEGANIILDYMKYTYPEMTIRQCDIPLPSWTAKLGYSLTRSHRTLIRLPDDRWILQCPKEAPEEVSDEEALSLLLQEGYPTQECPIPDDLWDLPELKRLGPDACMGMPHTVFARRLAVAVELLQKIVALAEQEPDDHTDEGGDPEHRARIVLRSREEGPIVLGKTKKKLTKARYNVVKTALEAPEGGWTKDQLVDKSGHGDALNVLRRLTKDPDWAQIIHMAGQTGGGYWIK